MNCVYLPKVDLQKAVGESWKDLHLHKLSKKKLIRSHQSKSKSEGGWNILEWPRKQELPPQSRRGNSWNKNLNELKIESIYQQKMIRHIAFTARLVLFRRAATLMGKWDQYYFLPILIWISPHPRIEVGQITPHHPPAHSSANFHSAILVSETLKLCC